MTVAPALARVGDVSYKLSPDLFAQRLSEGEWRTAPHLRYLARRVRETIIQPNGRLIVEMPPRHGKSELVSHWSPTWAIEARPTMRVLLSSYEADFAAEWGAASRDTLRQAIERKLVNVRLDATSAARARWRTTAGGGMWTAGAGGALTGRGGNVGIVDDPYKNWKEAQSKTTRDDVEKWYSSVMRTRLAPSGSLILVQTRWHEADLAGVLEANSENGSGEHYDVVRMPAIAEEDETWDLGNGEVWHRAKGEALWPQRYPLEELHAIRTALGSYLFAALYQQAPAPAEGGLVKRAWWQWYTSQPAPHEAEYLISWDSSFKDHDDADYCVGQVWARRWGAFFLLDEIRAQMDYPAFKRAVVALSNRWPQAHRILIEDTANGPAVIADLSLTTPGLIPITPKGSKTSRVIATSGVIEAGNVHLPDPSIAPDGLDIEAWVNEWAQFPNAANDDRVDAGTQALSYWLTAPDETTDSERVDYTGMLAGRR